MMGFIPLNWEPKYCPTCFFLDIWSTEIRKVANTFSESFSKDQTLVNIYIAQVDATSLDIVRNNEIKVVHILITSNICHFVMKTLAFTLTSFEMHPHLSLAIIATDLCKTRTLSCLTALSSSSSLSLIRAVEHSEMCRTTVGA